MSPPAGRNDPPAGDPAVAAATPIEVVRSEERLHVATERVAVERVRIAKRIVTETKMVTVQVRREELVVERLPVTSTDQHPRGEHQNPTGPVVELVLHEEVPDVSTRVVAVERVRISTTSTAADRIEQATVRREVIDVVEDTEKPGPASTPWPRR